MPFHNQQHPLFLQNMTQHQINQTLNPQTANATKQKAPTGSTDAHGRKKKDDQDKQRGMQKPRTTKTSVIMLQSMAF